MRKEYQGMLLGAYCDMPEDGNGKPTPPIVIGLGFGDECKGMAVAHESGRAVAMGLDVLNVRFNGGPQAAHNVRVRTSDGATLHHTHSQFGSGTLLGARTVLTQGMLFSPVSLAAEASRLSKLCDEPRMLSRLSVDRRCPVVLPLHAKVNQSLERARGNGKHGSTGLGIGIARTCEAATKNEEVPVDMLVTVESLGNRKALAKQLRFWKNWLEERFDVKLSQGREELEEEARWLHDGFSGLVSNDLHVLDDADATVRKAMDDGWTEVVFEGSQGILLDERYGWFPHVTYGDMTASNALGIADGRSTRILGITRCYQTRHGAGPMPTEGTYSADEPDNGTSEWAGAFRTGLLDMPTLARAADIVSPAGIAVSCLDRYPGRYVSWWESSREEKGIREKIPQGAKVREADESQLLAAIHAECNAGVDVLGRGQAISDWSDAKA